MYEKLVIGGLLNPPQAALSEVTVKDVFKAYPIVRTAPIKLDTRPAFLGSVHKWGFESFSHLSLDHIRFRRKHLCRSWLVAVGFRPLYMSYVVTATFTLDGIIKKADALA
jgi:hypothetical protein